MQRDLTTMQEDLNEWDHYKDKLKDLQQNFLTYVSENRTLLNGHAYLKSVKVVRVFAKLFSYVEGLFKAGKKIIDQSAINLGLLMRDIDNLFGSLFLIDSALKIQQLIEDSFGVETIRQTTTNRIEELRAASNGTAIERKREAFYASFSQEKISKTLDNLATKPLLMPTITYVNLFERENCTFSKFYGLASRLGLQEEAKTIYDINTFIDNMQTNFDEANEFDDR